MKEEPADTAWSIADQEVPTELSCQQNQVNWKELCHIINDTATTEVDAIH